MLRPLGGNQYQVLGGTGNQADPCDSQLHSYPASIPVQAGDVIGVYVVSNWQGLLDNTGSRGTARIPRARAVGDTITVVQSIGTIDESATLVSAGELAATLVSDATGVGPGRALFDKATAIQAASRPGHLDRVRGHHRLPRPGQCADREEAHHGTSGPADNRRG